MNHLGNKSKNSKKLKNKKLKNTSAIPDEMKRFATQEAETEDLAESVDSGCIPDSSSDTVADITSMTQMEAALLEENRFISDLVRWLPAPLQNKELEVETKKGKKRKHDEKEEEQEAEPGNKKQKVSVDIAETNADLDQLQERYRSMLGELRKNRNKKWDHGTKKKEAKLSKKLKVLEKRKDKRQKKKIKVPEQTEINKEKEKQEGSTKCIKPQKPIYNQKGELVFSKFDFSTQLSGDIDTNMKSRDLKQILSQTLKEKEKMKHLEKKGDKEGAISIAEHKAWSNALQKAEGKKVKSDVDMLKKSIKKQEIRKKTSQKKWEQRLGTMKKNKVDKQNQRKKNINARKDAKLERKMKKMKKKGHIVPGF